MVKVCTGIALLLLWMSSHGCSSRTEPSALANELNSRPEIEIASNIQSVDVRTWKVEVLGTAGSASNDLIDFISFAENGSAYGVGFTRVLKLSAGRKWEEIADTDPFGIRSLRFREDGLGVAAGYRKQHTSSGYIAVVLVSGDGQTWKDVYTAPGVILEGAGPSGGGTIWAYGRSKTDVTSKESRYFLAVSRDSGMSWVDLSESLNSIVLKEQPYVGDSVIDVVQSANRISILTIEGRVFESPIDEVKWRVAARRYDEGPKCVCRLFQSSSGEIRVAGGSVSDHGIWGIVAFEGNGAWTTHRMKGVMFRDVASVSESEILAVGDEYKGASSGEGRGIVLYSSNGGVSWEVVHRSKLSKAYNSVHVKDSATVLVGGQGGEIIVLRRD